MNWIRCSGFLDQPDLTVWVKGEDIREVLSQHTLTGGDFWIIQVITTTGQRFRYGGIHRERDAAEAEAVSLVDQLARIGHPGGAQVPQKAAV